MTTTITTTAQDDQRLATAFGTRLGLGRNANAAEIKNALINWLRAVVIEEERVAAERQQSAPFDPT